MTEAHPNDRGVLCDGEGRTTDVGGDAGMAGARRDDDEVGIGERCVIGDDAGGDADGAVNEITQEVREGIVVVDE